MVAPRSTGSPSGLSKHVCLSTLKTLNAIPRPCQVEGRYSMRSFLWTLISPTSSGMIDCCDKLFDSALAFYLSSFQLCCRSSCVFTCRLKQTRYACFDHLGRFDLVDSAFGSRFVLLARDQPNSASSSIFTIRTPTSCAEG